MAKILNGDTALQCEWAAAGDDGDEGLAADGFKARPVDGQSTGHEEDVDAAGGETGYLLFRGEFVDLELEVGVVGSEFADDGGEQDVLANRAAANAEAEACVEAVEGLFGGVDGVDDGLGVLAEGAASLGETDLLAVALEEFDAEGLFQGLDLKGDSGLAHVEHAGRPAVVEQVGEGEETLQLLDSEIQGEPRCR